MELQSLYQINEKIRRRAYVVGVGSFFNRSFVYPFNYVELTNPAFNLAWEETRAVKVEVTEETTGLNFQLKVYAIIRFDRSIGERRRDSLVKSSNNVNGIVPSNSL